MTMNFGDLFIRSGYECYKCKLRFINICGRCPNCQYGILTMYEEDLDGNNKLSGVFNEEIESVQNHKSDSKETSCSKEECTNKGN